MELQGDSSVILRVLCGKFLKAIKCHNSRCEKYNLKHLDCLAKKLIHIDLKIA
jgi:hypothetical protein